MKCVSQAQKTFAVHVRQIQLATLATSRKPDPSGHQGFRTSWAFVSMALTAGRSWRLFGQGDAAQHSGLIKARNELDRDLLTCTQILPDSVPVFAKYAEMASLSFAKPRISRVQLLLKR